MKCSIVKCLVQHITLLTKIQDILMRQTSAKHRPHLMLMGIKLVFQAFDHQPQNWSYSIPDQNHKWRIHQSYYDQIWEAIHPDSGWNSRQTETFIPKAALSRGFKKLGSTGDNTRVCQQKNFDKPDTMYKCHLTHREKTKLTKVNMWLY